MLRSSCCAALALSSSAPSGCPTWNATPASSRPDDGTCLALKLACSRGRSKVMKKQAQADPQMQKLADLIGEASIAMLTTEDSDGTLRSRPLATLQMDSTGKLWFFTGLSSGKVGEIDQHRKVNLSYVNLDKQ